MATITIGNSNIGYDSAEVMKTSTGKYRLVAGSVHGRISVIKKSIAALNRGEDCYTTSAMDQLPIQVKH